MKFLILFLTLNLISATQSYSCVQHEDGLKFLPDNQLEMKFTKGLLSGITKSDYDQVLDKIQEIYENKVNRYGYNLRINRLWNNNEVNAKASVRGELFFYGGLARHPATTKDNFALVACHEVGHLIGGFPKYPGSPLSAESQSDYFATLKCLRQFFLNDNNPAIVAKLNAPASLVKKCSRSHSNREDRAICIRSGVAALGLAKLLADASNNLIIPTFDSPDTRVASRTIHSYPSIQCRLDTFLQGSLCEKDFKEEVSQTEEVKGTCHPRTGHVDGVRPACWFKARL